ncbi:recombinase family protein [Arthrobacter sp. ISL-69]|uniref:recombinase family protein n=1 Tax=Arthrobacter sp. ISL-69 TaxID=2819113 RepID=UPI001BE598A9|nr:recombinase family protein [Arthrobacter sp. ISL-69]MBT2539052.1 recombinase family protein [Arthrobacter sp. ISL-69]
MNIIGYARVSTRDQDPQYQEHALTAAGASRVFTDHGDSSRIRDRPRWVTCLDYMRAGDTLLVHRLDRVSGEWHLFQLISELAERGINIRSLTEPEVDTTTPMGKAFYGIVAVFAQLRIDTIRENTMAGLAHARSQGRVGGRPTVMTPERVQTAVLLHEAGQNKSQIGRTMGVSRMAVARALARIDDIR